MAGKVFNPFLAADLSRLNEKVEEHEEQLELIKGGVVAVGSSEAENVDITKYPAGTLFVLYDDKE